MISVDATWSPDCHLVLALLYPPMPAYFHNTRICSNKLNCRRQAVQHSTLHIIAHFAKLYKVTQGHSKLHH